MPIKRGFTSYQLKIFAVVFMTLDHLQRALKSTRAFDLWEYSGYIWQLGRIAAPLFCFLIAESARHTRDRKKFLLRLYIAGLFTGVFSTLANIPMIRFFNIGSSFAGGMFFTFFFTVLHSYLIEGMVNSLRTRSFGSFAKNLSLFVFSFLPTIFYIGESSLFELLKDLVCSKAADRFMALLLYTNAFETLFPSPLMVEYSYVFVIMGICLYFAKEKWRMCGIFVGFCAFCYFSARLNIGIFQGFYGIGDQHYMILALPLMLLYNGMRGKEHKAFFYIYYPTHYFILMALSESLNKFFT